MHLAELLLAEAYTAGGEWLGQVHDVRARLDEAGDGPSLTVEGVIVGVGALSARLGYAYGEVAGPRIVAAVVRHLGRKALYLPWADVVSFEGGRLTVEGPKDRYRHPGEEDQRR